MLSLVAAVLDRSQLYDFCLGTFFGHDPTAARLWKVGNAVDSDYLSLSSYTDWLASYFEHRILPHLWSH
jgi:hypothetical protein